MTKYFNLSKIKSYVSTQYQKRPTVVLAVAAAIVLFVFGLIAMVVIGSFGSANTTASLPYPTILSTSVGSNSRLTIDQTPTPVVTTTPTPIPNIWEVAEIFEIENINGYNGLVISLRNIYTGETKRAQCQQAHWDRPELGHQYRLVNTFTGHGVEYWLFIPIEGVEDSAFQRFAPIP